MYFFNELLGLCKDSRAQATALSENDAFRDLLSRNGLEIQGNAIVAKGIDDDTAGGGADHSGGGDDDDDKRHLLPTTPIVARNIRDNFFTELDTNQIKRILTEAARQQ
jgi:hypothetical protein